MFTSALTGGNPKVPSSLNIPGDLKKSIFSTASGRPPRSILGLPLIPKSLFHFYENAASPAEHKLSLPLLRFFFSPLYESASTSADHQFSLPLLPSKGGPLVRFQVFHLYQSLSSTFTKTLPLLQSTSFLFHFCDFSSC